MNKRAFLSLWPNDLSRSLGHYWGIEQRSARLAHNQEVGGSNPSAPNTMINVTPIIIPKIDWEKLLTIINSTTGLNRQGSGSGDFLLLLNGLTDGQSSKITDLRNLKNGLQHLSFSFLVICFKDTLFELVQRLNGMHFFTFSTKRDGIVGVILTGTMEQWKWAIVNSNDEDDTTLIFNECQKYFEQLGLAQLWGNYKKVGRDPFRLELK